MQRLEDIEKLNKGTLVPTDVCEYLGCHPYSINCQAKEDPSKLGFPVVVIGTRVLIPKEGFVNYMRHGGRPPFLEPMAPLAQYRPEGLRIKGYRYVGHLVPVFETIEK